MISCNDCSCLTSRSLFIILHDPSLTSLRYLHIPYVVTTTTPNLDSEEKTFQWQHNERDGISNHRRLDCLLNRLFRNGSKKTSKLRVTGLCERNLPVAGGFPSQRANNAENVPISWRHHEIGHHDNYGLCMISILWLTGWSFCKRSDIFSTVVIYHAMLSSPCCWMALKEAKYVTRCHVTSHYMSFFDTNNMQVAEIASRLTRNCIS